MLELIIKSSLPIFAFFSLLFLLAVYKKNNSIVDIAWGLSFVLIASFTFFETQIFHIRSIILLTATIFWGIRLSAYIVIRNHGKKEDFRYANWRKQWGKSFYLRSFFQIFILQAFLMLIISLPIIFTIKNPVPTPLYLLDYIGLTIFIFGFLFETIGDYQLYQFKKDPKNKGQIMTTGLWSTTRHPNYFGETLVWWGIYLIALSAGYYFTIISPLLITFLLLRVSGVTMLEKKYQDNKKYQEYIKKTPAFLPKFL